MSGIFDLIWKLDLVIQNKSEFLGVGVSFGNVGPTYCLLLAPLAVALLENGLRWPASPQIQRE